MWFSKKKAEVEDPLKLAQHQLSVLVKENEMLSFKIEDLQESDMKNHLMLTEFQERAAKSDMHIQELTVQLQTLEATIAAQDETIQILSEEIADLETQTEFKGGQPESMQEVLDEAEAQGELVVFKDSKGNCWQLMRRPELMIDEERSDDSNEADLRELDETAAS
mmetsp:Transcript_21621/g.39538  ORF Transcript_21621/g.39538 Transcript_21621/m.39538 type:complete len:165 (-) Transcript_21621:998-1492(-)